MLTKASSNERKNWGQFDFLFPALDLMLRMGHSQIDAETDSLVLVVVLLTLFFDAFGNEGNI